VVDCECMAPWFGAILLESALVWLERALIVLIQEERMSRLSVFTLATLVVCNAPTGCAHEEQTWSQPSGRRLTATTPETSEGGSTGAPALPGGAGNTGGLGDDGQALPLPLYVDQYFTPSGYMGDGMHANAILDESDCKLPRAPGVLGLCHKFTYTPQTHTAGSSTWGGVFWQYPEGNWGAVEGRLVQPGATNVKFYAAGANGGETVKFLVGVRDSTLPYEDSIRAEKSVVLTTEWTEYAVSFAGQSYERVIGPLGWSIATSQLADPIVFYLDDIRWE
jgi:hypothetical protein